MDTAQPNSGTQVDVDYSDFIEQKTKDMIDNVLDTDSGSDTDCSTQSLPVNHDNTLTHISRTPQFKRRRQDKLTPHTRMKSCPKKLAEIMLMVKQQVELQVSDKLQKTFSDNMNSAIKDAIQPLLLKLEEKDKKMKIMEGIIQSRRNGTGDSSNTTGQPLDVEILLVRIAELEATVKSLKSSSQSVPTAPASPDPDVISRMNDLETAVKSIESNYNGNEAPKKTSLSDHDKFVLQNLDDHEQYSRRNCLRFTGIHAVNDADTTDIIKKVCASIGVEVNNNDISRSHYVGKPRDSDGARMIIVRFIRYDKRLQVIINRSKLRKLDANHEYAKVHINEDLTKNRYSILQLMIKDKKEGKLFSCWSRDGKLYYKETDKSKPTRIYNTLYLNNELITSKRRNNDRSDY